MRTRCFAAALLAAAACAQRDAPPRVTAPVSRAALPPAAPAAREDAGLVSTLLAPPGGRFTVRLPGPPHEDEVASAPLTMHVFESETEGGAVYAVAYTDYPDDFPASSDPERLLDAARDALVDPPAGKLVFESRITLAPSTPGREGTIRREDHVIVARLYAEGARVFELTVRAPENAPIDDDRAAFFDSFVIERPSDAG
jgi:hypothetical protein